MASQTEPAYSLGQHPSVAAASRTFRLRTFTDVERESSRRSCLNVQLKGNPWIVPSNQSGRVPPRLHRGSRVARESSEPARYSGRGASIASERWGVRIKAPWALIQIWGSALLTFALIWPWHGLLIAAAVVGSGLAGYATEFYLSRAIFELMRKRSLTVLLRAVGVGAFIADAVIIHFGFGYILALAMAIWIIADLLIAYQLRSD